MRSTLILAIVSACGSQQIGVELESGPLISVTEGDPPRHIHVIGAAKLTTSPDATWASFDSANGDLVIAPPCTAVPGTSGAPRLFYMQLDSTEVVVQVQPSATGACAPSLSACLTMEDCTQVATCAPADALGHVPIVLRYMTRFDPDQTLVFTIDNPDPSVPLAGHLTTDAPIKFPENPNSTSFCAYAPNSNIVGNFTIDWSVTVAPASESAAVISSGEYRLDWNADEAYDVEIDSCAADGAHCALHRYTDPMALQNGAQWCIDYDSPSPVATTLGLRIWAQSMMGMDSYKLELAATLRSGPDVTLTSSTTRMTKLVDFQVSHSLVPVDIMADLTTPAATDELVLLLGPVSAPTRTVKVAVMPACPVASQQPHAHEAR